MLDLHVLPEQSIGNEQWNFVLGMPLYQVVQILQTHCRVMKSVEVVYSDKQPLESDLVLTLTSDGIKLIFDSRNQRLKMIEVYDLSKVKLKYCDNYFNSPQKQPTAEQIEQTFGATRPGHYDANYQAYIMSFRGITFFFQVSQQLEAYFAEHPHTHPATSSLAPDDIPVVCRMCIYSGSNLKETVAPAMPESCYHGNLYLQSAEVLLEENEAYGLQLNLVSVASDAGVEVVNFSKSVRFGDSAQHVLSEIGSPCKVFYKPPDKMRIHSASLRKLSEARNTDYFYNYFTLGIDILFDGELHRVKKFILHTNFPGHYNFNIYYRCNFKINLTEQSASGSESKVTIDPCTFWKAVTSGLGYNAGKPVVLNRASSTNNTNPFGPTHCFGLRNMIFEVMPNDHIAAVTLYKPQNPVTSAA